MKWWFSFLLFPAPAFAFTLGGADNSLIRGWNTTEIVFHINASGCSVSEEILKRGFLEAISLWNSVPGSSITLKLGDASTMNVAGAHATAVGDPTVMCDTTFSSTTGLDASVASGAGYFRLVGDTISFGYILLNEQGTTASIGQLTYRHLTILLAHEIGHVLGLGHSEDPNALMYPDITRRNELSLSQDDMDGLTYLYPRHEPSDPVFGCGTITTPSSGPGGPGPLINALGMFLLSLLVCFKNRVKLERYEAARP